MASDPNTSSFSTPPDQPSPQADPSPSPRWVLKRGLTALEQRHYDEAIATLTPLLTQAKPTTPPQQTKTQAQIHQALAKAHRGAGNPAQALKHCQWLSQYPNPKVQQWATRAIAHLQQQRPDTPNAPATPNRDHAPPGARASTGFVPLESTPPQTTGFTPLSAATPTAQAQSSPSASRPSSAPSRPAAAAPPLDAVLSEDDAMQAPVDPEPTPAPAETMAPAVPATSDQRRSLSTPARSMSAVALDQLPWRQAARAKRWSSLRPNVTAIRRLSGVLVYTWTAIALWVLATVFLRVGMAMGTPLRDTLSRFVPVPRWYFLEAHPGRVAALVLVGLLLLSPLLLDLILRQTEKLKPLSLEALSTYSPEATSVLKTASKQGNHPIPGLRLIASSVPLMMSYGLRPRWSRIVISDGLLRQLSEDELATLYAREVAHIQQWHGGVMTLVTVAAHFSYSLYRGFGAWADGQRNGLLQWLGGVGSAITYGMFWLVRGTGLWLARTRSRHSDRVAANLTGNPNGLMRALLKLAIATATDIRRQGHTDPLLERFECVMPIGVHAAISMGSVFPRQWQEAGATTDPPTHDAATSGLMSDPDTPTLIDWDYRNPHSRLFAINNPHPPLGDRLHTLAQAAKRWKLPPELEGLTRAPAPAAKSLMLQIAPFIGIPVGAALTFVLWIVGLVANQFDWPIEWLRYEASSLFWAMLAVSFSVGTILRINRFFPDIKGNRSSLANLGDRLTRPTAIPIDSDSIWLEGKLLGRRGTENWLNQDLILHTEAGLIRLHGTSVLGSAGHLLFDRTRLQALTGRTVLVKGWLRRGATPWLDIDTITPKGGKAIQNGHPIWSTLVAVMAALWGIYTLYQG